MGCSSRGQTSLTQKFLCGLKLTEIELLFHLYECFASSTLYLLWVGLTVQDLILAATDVGIAVCLSFLYDFLSRSFLNSGHYYI